MKTMWFTFFYGAMIPLGIPLSMIGVTLYYYVDKFNIYFRRCIKERLGPELSDRMVTMLELVIPFNGFGNFIVSYRILKVVNKIDIVIMIIGFGYALMPWKRIVDWMFNLHDFDSDV